MNKKYSFIPLGINNQNNQNSLNNKNYLIPHPKNNIQILNHILLNKKGRNNNKTINQQSNSFSNEKDIAKIKNLNNTDLKYTNQANPNNINNNTLSNGDKIILDLFANMKLNKNNFSKHLSFKDISDKLDICDKDTKDKNSNNNNDKEINSQYEYNIIKEKIEKGKKDMDDVKKNIEKLNKKMIDMKNTLEKLKIEKSEKKREIENLLSNKETLEEMYNLEILFIKNGQISLSNSKENCNINISIEEIQQININKFKMQVIEMIKILFNNEDDIIDSISNTLSQTYNNFTYKISNTLNSQNELISEFFGNISETISNISNNNKNKYSLSSINSLLHYLIKINCINKKIENSQNYLKNNYKLKKQEINEQLIEITMSLIIFENQKHEILTLTSKLKEELKNLQQEKEKNNIIINENINNLNLKNVFKTENKLKDNTNNTNNTNNINNNTNNTNNNTNKTNNINITNIKNNTNNTNNINNINNSNNTNNTNNINNTNNTNNINNTNNTNNTNNINNTNKINSNISSNKKIMTKNEFKAKHSNININLNINNITNSKEINNEETNPKEYYKNFSEHKNNSNGGNIGIRYDNNLNKNIFSEREEAKNKIYENYINNGIALNDNKKRRIKKYRLNFNSISGNRSKEKDKEKITNEKNNYSTSFNYNFNTNFMDIKVNKNSLNSDRKNILILKNTFDSNDSKLNLNNKKNNSNNNLNKHKRKIINGNDDFTDFISLNFTQSNKRKKFENRTILNKNHRFLSSINNDFKKPNINEILNQTRLKRKKSYLRNNESFLTNYKKKNNHRLSNFQKYLVKSITNSSLDSHENYKSTNNIKNNNSNLYTNNEIFKSFHNKSKNISNIKLNDLENNNINITKNSQTNRNTYNINKMINKKKLSDININVTNLLNAKKSRKMSSLNYETKKLLKLSNNSYHTLNSHNETSNTANNRANGFYSLTSDLDNQLKIFNQGEMESFCFYKIFDKNINYNSKKYNPLNDCSINPEYFGYYECNISIDVISGSLKISPIIPFERMKYLPNNNEYISIINNKKNEFYINIKLKEIIYIFIEKYMQNVVKIQKILMKYNKQNNNMYNGYYINNSKANKLFSINKIMNKKEMNELKIDKNEKIKAALCNFFSFSFSLGNKNSDLSKTKIDLVFINFEQFNIWLNTINSIVKNNIKFSKINMLSKKKIFNSNQKTNDKSKDKTKKKNSESNFKKIFNINFDNEIIRTKSNIQSNNLLKIFGIK